MVRGGFLLSIALVLLCADTTLAAETLFESEPLTRSGLFTGRIEGPSVDVAGNLYVCNFGADGTVGRLRPGSAAPESFVRLRQGSIPNGSRFGKDGRMFLADWKGHMVFVVDAGARAATLYFGSKEFHQPNDLAIATDGTLF